VAFTMRGLELHGRHMWSRGSVVRALDVVVRNGLDTLVLHETDLVQMVTYPRSYLDPYGLWRNAPTRRGENAIENNRVWLDWICRRAARRGVRVLVEVKEIGFPDEILELRPELLKDGVVCPSEPFWTEFIERKTDEFLADFPLVAGMVSSAGSTEGKTSRAQNKCRCPLCQATSLEDWYHGIIGALHRATSRHGRLLAVREFAYKPADHAPLLAAIDRAPADVILCSKATPHDFYLGFPHNPAIGRPGRVQWLEYDTMGQFWGWGLFPCMPLEDMRSRFAHAEAKGVSGGFFRVEWERINDLWSLDGLNGVNLILAAAFAAGAPIDATEASRRWLADARWPEEAAKWLGGILSRTEAIMRGALYIDGFVFADNSMYPRSLRRAWWGMETRDALHSWDPSRASDLVMDRARVVRLIGEKRQAAALAAALAADVRHGDASVPPALHAGLVDTFDRMADWIDGFRMCGEVCLYARWCDPEHRRDDGPGVADLAAFAAALDALEGFAGHIRPIAEAAELRHQIVLLMDHRRVADIAREGRAVLAHVRGDN
jgi:hypothetical protein